MVAVALGDATVMRALLRAGANACHAGIGDLTPLHIAAGKRRKQSWMCWEMGGVIYAFFIVRGALLRCVVFVSFLIKGWS